MLKNYVNTSISSVKANGGVSPMILVVEWKEMQECHVKYLPVSNLRQYCMRSSSFLIAQLQWHDSISTFVHIIWHHRCNMDTRATGNYHKTGTVLCAYELEKRCPSLGTNSRHAAHHIENGHEKWLWYSHTNSALFFSPDKAICIILWDRQWYLSH